MADLAATSDPATLAAAAPAVPGFEAWYRAEHAHVLRVVAALVADGQAAQDVTAEAFARALARWDRVGAMERPTGWVFRVAVNLARRRARRSALEHRLLRSPAGPRAGAEGVVDRFERDHQAAETWDAVRGLPPRQRLAVVLRYLEDLPEAEIAIVMGVSPGTVAATLHAARSRLAESWRTE